MGLFKRLLGGTSEAPASSVSATLLDDGPLIELDVMGESNYQDALWRVLGKRYDGTQHRLETVAVLVPEKDNPYDADAVYVSVRGAKVGYLSRDNAAKFRPGLLRLMDEHGAAIAVRATIVGGRDHEDGRPGMLGVWVALNSEVFGVPLPPPRPSAGTYTGASACVRGDWLQSLPEDNTRAIKKLRSLLASEADPCERHFMFLELEERLYKSRDAFASALDEFAQTCEDHHADMAAARPIIIERAKGIPFVSTYKRAAIMWQKRGDHARALEWAERGLEVYGDETLRPEDVEDLQKRAEKHRAALERKR